MKLPKCTFLYKEKQDQDSIVAEAVYTAHCIYGQTKIRETFLNYMNSTHSIPYSPIVGPWLGQPRQKRVYVKNL